MNAASVKRDQTRETSLPDFIHGKKYFHVTGQVVSFDDMSWCISPIRGKQVTVYFGDLPNWLTRPAKLVTARGWLEEGLSKNFLTGRISSFRRLAKWLGDFEGASIAELTRDHVTILQTRLANELTRYNDTFEEASLQIGRALSLREVKKVCRESGLTGPKSVSSFVGTFNAAASLLEEIDGHAISIRLKVPRTSNNGSSRDIGSADPNKVLRPEQLAELERALGRDQRRYEKARALLDRRLGEIDLRRLEQKRLNPVLDLERYFGINGHKEHSSSEIAVLNGQSPTLDMNVTRRLKTFLSRRLGPDITAKLLRLRSRFHYLRQQNRFDELSTDREYILSVLTNADLLVQEPKTFCIERYFGLHGYRVHSALAIAKQLGLTTPSSVGFYIRKGLFPLIGKEKAERLLAIRGRLLYYLVRAIKAQAIRLQLAVARRISAVLETPVRPKITVGMVEARRVVEIQFRAGKTWGDEGLSEWVPCVDKFGEIAEDAISTCQRLTESLRLVASEECRELLFIIPDNSFEDVVPLSTKVLHEYVYTNQKGKDAGLLRRYALEGLLNFELHNVRQTHATHMIEEGGTIQDVARYLGHITFNGSTNMAGVFYLAGGTEAMRKRTAEALRQGAATGLQFDGIARMKIEAMGEEAKKVSVPPNQLSFEQARQRVLSADIVEDVPVDAAEAVRLLNQKIVFNVTRYGGCLLQATGGHCPTANPCPIGIVASGEEPTPGCGCKYLVLLPHSADQLSADLAPMEAQFPKMVGDALVGWRVHTKAKIDHWRSLLEIAVSLNKREEGSCE